MQTKACCTSSCEQQPDGDVIGCTEILRGDNTADDVQNQNQLPDDGITFSNCAPAGLATREVAVSMNMTTHCAHDLRTRATPSINSPKSISSLNSNLSELDSLLQELSSAQFNIELERRNAGELSQPAEKKH